MGDAGGPVDVHAYVAFINQPGLARVQAHPDAHLHILWPLVLGQGALNFNDGRYGIGCSGERSKERIAFGTDLPAAVIFESVSHDETLVGQQLGISLAQLI
jgi:hypothetical protein